MQLYQTYPSGAVAEFVTRMVLTPEIARKLLEELKAGQHVVPDREEAISQLEKFLDFDPEAVYSQWLPAQGPINKLHNPS